MDNTVIYFSHDSNARNDPKMVKLRQSKDGLSKYGVYWMLIEKLRDSKGYMLEKDYNSLAWELRCENSLVKSVIEDFGLFDFTENGKCLYSESLMRRMQLKETKSEKASESARVRWDKVAKQSEDDANALLSDSERNASKVKESKVKERKESKVKSISHSGEPPPKKELEVMDYWKDLVEVWFSFNEQKFGERPSFKDADPKHLKKIALALKKRAEEKGVEWTSKISVMRLTNFFTDSFNDTWLKSNFLLPNLDKQMDKIILNQPKLQTNGNNKTATNATAQLDGLDYSVKLR